MKCSNVVECALLVCVLCQLVPPSSHPSIWQISFYYNFFAYTCTVHTHKNLFNKLHLFDFSDVCRSGIFWQHTCLSRHFLCEDNIVITVMT